MTVPRKLLVVSPSNVVTYNCYNNEKITSSFELCSYPATSFIIPFFRSSDGGTGTSSIHSCTNYSRNFIFKKILELVPWSIVSLKKYLKHAMAFELCQYMCIFILCKNSSGVTYPQI